MEFHGFVKLDLNLVDILGPYLEERESEFGQAIIHAVEHVEHPAPIPPDEFEIRLFEAVEIFGKRLRSNEGEWRQIGEEVNQAAWHYLEFLEGCSLELFRYLKSVGLEQWKPELAHAVDQIKIMLAHHLEDLHWALKRMETQLWQFRWKSEKRMGRSVWLQKLFSFGESILDKTLFTNVEKTERYLAFQYMKFANRYQEYRNLHAHIEKLGSYEVLDGFDLKDRQKFHKMHELLAIWEANRRAKVVPQSEVAVAVNAAISPERAKKLFKEYFHILYEKLFAYSRNLKREEKEELKTAGSYSQEALFLASLIAKYRDFLLRTDANPYVRARLGFTEWIVGPEPKQTKELLDLSYDVEGVKQRFDTLAAEENEPTVNVRKMEAEVKRLLHALGQPLISKSSIKSTAQKILKKIESLNELSTANPFVVDIVAETLSKLMKADWKYNVLFDIPAFHEIYTLHCGIAGHTGDERQHLHRINKLKQMTQQILSWVKNGTTLHHQHEFDLDLSDIKGCLQDFLAYIQRMNQEKESTEQLKRWTIEMERQLLEYRYLFGKFFHDLQQIEPDERLTRSQFLFVDRYFDTISDLLTHIKERPLSQKEEQQKDDPHGYER